MIPVQTTLDKAAELIERDGWCQLRTGSPGTPHCILGAVRDGLREMGFDGRGAEYEAARQEIYLRLANHWHRGRNAIIGWHDDPSTTRQDVLDVLRDRLR